MILLLFLLHGMSYTGRINVFSTFASVLTLSSILPNASYGTKVCPAETIHHPLMIFAIVSILFSSAPLLTLGSPIRNLSRSITLPHFPVLAELLSFLCLTMSITVSLFHWFPYVTTTLLYLVIYPQTTQILLNMLLLLFWFRNEAAGYAEKHSTLSPHQATYFPPIYF